MRVKSEIYIPQSNKRMSSSQLNSEVFVSIYSNQTFEISNIKNIEVVDGLTGYPIDERIIPSKGEWMHPVYGGNTDVTTLIYHITLTFNSEKTLGGKIAHVSIPKLSVYLTFADNSSLRTWPTAGDGFEATTLAFNFK